VGQRKVTGQEIRTQRNEKKGKYIIRREEDTKRVQERGGQNTSLRGGWGRTQKDTVLITTW
jgi:hypothetical protein